MRYGSDLDTTAGRNNYVKALGTFIFQTAIINNSLVIYYEKDEETTAISIFSGKEELINIEPNFGEIEISSFSFIESTGELLCLLEYYDDSKCYFWKLNQNRKIEDRQVVINEETYSNFIYPYFFIVKGCHELIWYNIQDNNFIYAYIPSPIISIDNFDQYGRADIQNYKIIVDLGHSYSILYLNHSSMNDEDILSLEYNKKYIDKNKLPKDTLLQYIGTLDVKKKNTKENYLAHVLHFANYLVTYSDDWEETIIIKNRQYRKNEIKFVNLGYSYSGKEMKGLMMFKEDNKKIFLHWAPLNFDDKSYIKTVYESQDLVNLKLFILGYEFRGPER